MDERGMLVRSGIRKEKSTRSQHDSIIIIIIIIIMSMMIEGERNAQRNRQPAYNVPRPGWHFQQTMSTGIQRLLERAHVLELFQINAIVGKENVEAIQIEPHDR
jgi:hypothetical protein